MSDTSNEQIWEQTPLKAVAGCGVSRVGCGGSRGPGGVLGLAAVAELDIFGVRPVGMRARVFAQKALPSVPGDGGWPAEVAARRQAGLVYHLGCGSFCSPQIREPQPTCSEWWNGGPTFGHVSLWHLNYSYH